MSAPDVLPVVSGGTTYKVSASVMQNYMTTVADAITINSNNNATAIINGGGNAVGNIGSTTKYFNTAFITATSAQYADLAECYLADTDYEPGTVLMFGGSAEVTQCDHDACPAVAGVVSSQPAHLMNAQLVGDHVVALALIGRVPCRVQGPVAKGSLLVSAGDGRARSESDPRAGTIIGKSLQDFDGQSGTIEIVIGRT